METLALVRSNRNLIGDRIKYDIRDNAVVGRKIKMNNMVCGMKCMYLLEKSI